MRRWSPSCTKVTSVVHRIWLYRFSFMPEWCFRSCDLDLMSGLSTIQEETLIGGDMKKSSFSGLPFGVWPIMPISKRKTEKGRPMDNLLKQSCEGICGLSRLFSAEFLIMKSFHRVIKSTLMNYGRQYRPFQLFPSLKL